MAALSNLGGDVKLKRNVTNVKNEEQQTSKINSNTKILIEQINAAKSPGDIVQYCTTDVQTDVPEAAALLLAALLANKNVSGIGVDNLQKLDNSSISNVIDKIAQDLQNQQRTATPEQIAVLEKTAKAAKNPQLAQAAIDIASSQKNKNQAQAELTTASDAEKVEKSQDSKSSIGKFASKELEKKGNQASAVPGLS